MNKVITRTVYEIIVSRGCWEDYAENLLGIYATYEDAQAHCCYGMFDEEVYEDRTIDPYYQPCDDDSDWEQTYSLHHFMELKIPVFINASGEYIYYYDEYDSYDLSIRENKVDINVDMSKNGEEV
jgi:hypothetical protein